MPHFELNRVAFAYGGGGDVLRDINLSLTDCTGVVGENGGGKTTFLRLLAGTLRPSRGQLHCSCPPADRVLCRQRAGDLDPDVREFATRWDKSAMRWRSLLELTDLASDFTLLSPGERKRWQLASALECEPPILLLDEPTNHLDARGKALLIKALEQYRGLSVVVSHDRELLDRLTRRTIRVDRGLVTALPLPYSQANAQWTAERRREERVHQERRAEARKLARFQADLRERRARAERSISARTRIKGPKDSDARSVNARGRAESGAAALARRVSAANTRAARAKGALVDAKMARKLGGALAIREQPERGTRLLARFHGDLRIGDHVLAPNLHLDIARGQRVWLRGDNGVGKTTLLRALVAAARPDDVLFIAQELRGSEPALRQLCSSLPADERGAWLAMVGALGCDPERVLASPELSPGQLRKLTIARGLARGYRWLALDEPTNHLDLPSIERLERALANFRGALVIVTHDTAFAHACELEPCDLLQPRAGGLG